MEVGREIEHSLQIAEFGRIFIDIRLRVLLLLLRLAVYLQSMLVGAGIKKYIITKKRMVAREYVGMHKLKRKADMRIGVHVRQSRC